MRSLARIALVAGVLAVAACGKGSKEHLVIMRGMVFDPPELVVASGDKVTWRNDDIVAHTATADGRFDSGEVPPGGTYSVTVRQKGALRYRCTMHPTMLASLDVR
jgi:plastocyanin